MDHQPLLVLTTLIVVASARQAPYLPCLRVLRLAIRPRSVLQTAKGSNHKSIDNYTLFAVMAAAIDDADQPSTTDVLEQLLEVINHTFDFQKKVSVNMELMQLNAARMATYGIAISIPQLTLMLIANIQNATKAEYGHKF